MTHPPTHLVAFVLYITSDYSFTHTLTHLLSSTHSHIHSHTLIHPLIHPLPHSLTTPSLTPPHIHSLMQVYEKMHKSLILNHRVKRKNYLWYVYVPTTTPFNNVVKQENSVGNIIFMSVLLPTKLSRKCIHYLRDYG